MVKYLCEYCGLPFKTKHSLVGHFSYHKRRGDVPDPFLSAKCCSTYSRIVMSAAILEAHNQNYVNNYTKNCPVCGKEFISKDSTFCSSKCAATLNNKLRSKKEKQKIKLKKDLYYDKKRKPLICHMCGATWTPIYRYVKNLQKTCSDECQRKSRLAKAKLRVESEETKQKRSIAGRKSAAKRVKRSKQEIELFEICNKHFSSVTHNEQLVDAWDADIVLKQYKIAILWNGPWHYKEMNIGNHSLKQVQNRDRLKTKLFKEAGWTVLIYEDRHFTPQTAFEDIKKYVKNK